MPPQFHQSSGVRADLRGVFAVGVPLVVFRVQEGIATNFEAAAGGIVEVVSLGNDNVGGARESNAPVVGSTACS